MPVGRSFDITLNGRGYMLARGQFAGRAWRRTGQPNAVQPRSTDSDLQRNALPPELDFVAVYDDFSGGFGDAYRNPQSANRIHWASNMEVRFPQQAIHCQQPLDLLTNSNLSASGAVNGGFNGAAWIMQVPTTPGLGQAGPVGQGAVLIAGRSRQGYLTRYTPTGIGIYGVLQASGSAFDTTGELDFSINGTTLSGSAPSMPAFWGRPAVFGSYAWFGGDPASTMPQFRRRDMMGLAGISATVSQLNGATFAVAGQRMWRAHGPSGGHVKLLQSVSITDDPMGTANWSATLSVGNGQEDVQDMVALDEQLFVSTQGGLYAGDTSGTFFNVLGDMVGQAHPDNGRNLTIYNRGIAYPYTGGLLLYQQLDTAAIARDISPNQNSQRSPLRGRFRAVTTYGGWLYGGLWTGSIGVLIAGRDRGDGAFIWNPLQTFSPFASGPAVWQPNAIRQLTTDTVSTPSGGGGVASGNSNLPSRFWVAMEASFSPDQSSNSSTRWWNMPPGDTNPLGAAGFSANYTFTASMYFGRDNRGAPDTRKVLRRVDVNTDGSSLFNGADFPQIGGSSGGAYCNVYYSLDGGGRQLLGRAATSPKSTLYFPAAAGSFTTCYDFELSIDSFSAGTLGILNGNGGAFANPNTPVYRSFVVHGAFLAEGSDEITAVIDVAGRRADRGGTPMRSAAAQLTELRGLAGGAPVQLVDLTGAQNWVTVQRSIDEAETYEEGADEPEVAATVKLSVLRFS